MEGRDGHAETKPLETALEKTIRAGGVILLDTSTLLHYLGPVSPLSDVAAILIDDFIHSGRNRGIVSAVSAMDLLVGPIRAGSTEYVQRNLEFLRYFPNLTIQTVDLSVAVEAAALRAQRGLAAPDALIVASGVVAGASHLITNDLEWAKRLAGLETTFDVVELQTFAREMG